MRGMVGGLVVPDAEAAQPPSAGRAVKAASASAVRRSLMFMVPPLLCETSENADQPFKPIYSAAFWKQIP